MQISDYLRSITITTYFIYIEAPIMELLNSCWQGLKWLVLQSINIGTRIPRGQLVCQNTTITQHRYCNPFTQKLNIFHPPKKYCAVKQIWFWDSIFGQGCGKLKLKWHDFDVRHESFEVWTILMLKDQPCSKPFHRKLEPFSYFIFPSSEPELGPGLADPPWNTNKIKCRVAIRANTAIYNLQTL